MTISKPASKPCRMRVLQSGNHGFRSYNHPMPWKVTGCFRSVFVFFANNADNVESEPGRLAN